MHKYGFSNIDIRKDSHGIYTMVGMRDVWDIPALRGNQPEHVRFPTQKPIALYDRIALASSNEADMILDPFCGCATTLIAAERNGRKWVGIDIWDNAKNLVVERLEQEYLAAPRSGTTGRLAFGESNYVRETLERTDDKQEVVPFLRPKYTYKEPNSKRMTRQEMYAHLIDQHGSKC